MMALFARVLQCIPGYSYQRDGDGYDEDVSLNPFVALIEVRSRKSGTPRFVVYGANIFEQPTNPFEKRYPENIYTECSSLESGQRIFRSYCRGLVPCFSPAPFGFYKFMVSQGVFFREKPDVALSYFPRWVKAGKRSGRRRAPKQPKRITPVFGDLHCLVAIYQQRLTLMQNDFLRFAPGLSAEAKEECERGIETVASEVARLRSELREVMQKKEGGVHNVPRSSCVSGS